MARTDNLEFLVDVIPQVHAQKAVRETKAARGKRGAGPEAGQRTLSDMMGPRKAADAGAGGDGDVVMDSE